MKKFLRFSRASGSTRRKVEQIIRQGERALSARHRRALVERLDYAQ